MRLLSKRMSKYPDDIASLPIFPQLDSIADGLMRAGMLLVQAEPGAGKTTLVPWKLLQHEHCAKLKILLLQPRRIAARAAADRIAGILGERIGERVGLRTRLETHVGPKTILEVVTEGILTRIIQNDQSLSRYGAVIFDEFHERSLASDTGLAFVMDCRENLRPDLAVLFMSATPSADELIRAFGDFPVISVPGRAFPVEVSYHPPLAGEKPWDGAARLTGIARETLDANDEGDVLVFLPGFREIRRTADRIIEAFPAFSRGITVLHGQLPPEEQRRVLDPVYASTGRIILATNVAETSVTIPGVRAVVDAGLERRVRYQSRTGMDHWDTVPISRASAEQRKGRAGRLGPGACLRWWNEHETRAEFSLPEIMESDLAPLLLETALWGAPSPYGLQWLTPPPQAAVRRALTLLGDLGLLDPHGRITQVGRMAAGLGLHPRLGRMIITAADRGWLASAAVTAALLEEGDPLGGDDPDFRERLSAWSAWSTGCPGGMRDGAARRIGIEAERILRAAGRTDLKISGGNIDPGLAGRLLVLAYPDRAAQRVSAGTGREGSRWVLASGRGARLQGALDREEFVSVADLDGGDTDARIFLAAPIDRGELEKECSNHITEHYIVEWDGWAPRSRSEKRLGRLVLHEKKGDLPPQDELQSALMERIEREGIACLPWDDALRLFRSRCLFVQRCGNRADWPDFTDESLMNEIDLWLFPYGNWNGGQVFSADALRSALDNRLGWERRRVLDECAPEQMPLPSGTHKRIDYESGGVPVVAARLQEFFGCRETPKFCGIPVMLHLLSPAGRPVQITRDLDGFWDRAYPEVKKELMGRYPKHYWPDDPRVAEPTARAKPRK